MQQLAISLNQIFGWNIAISTIVALAIGALWVIYFNKIKEKQKSEFQKQIEIQKLEFSRQLETLKAKNDKINYITKTQFDAEFKIYQELLNNIYNLIESINTLDRGVNYKVVNYLSVKKDEFVTVIERLQLLRKKVMQYASFIKKEMYETFLEFIKTVDDIFVNSFNYEIINKEIRYTNAEYILENFQQVAQDIYKKLEIIIQKLREYLQTLKVMDGNNE